jgi:GTP:adenosylcobinamide-phosphate guanylyltransferase
MPHGVLKEKPIIELADKKLIDEYYHSFRVLAFWIYTVTPYSGNCSSKRINRSRNRLEQEKT